MKPIIERYEQTLDVKPGKAYTNQYALEDHRTMLHFFCMPM